MNTNKLLLAILFTGLVTGCSNGSFKGLGSQILSSTGYVNGSQADGILDAGGKIIKSQESLTSEQEYYLGRAVSAKIVAEYPPVNKADLTKYVNEVGRVVAGVSDVPETFAGYHFVVVESPHINAMAAPSGFIFVTSTFVKLLPNEDALAAVLAHEVAHVVKRDGVNAISNANLFGALSQVTQQGVSVAAGNLGSPVDLTQITDVFGESVGGVVDKLLTSGYDRSQEYEADAYAVTLLSKAGYDPTAMKQVLQILESKKGTDNSGWYSTHPDPEDRIDEVDDALDDLPKMTESPSIKIRAARFSQATRSL